MHKNALADSWARVSVMALALAVAASGCGTVDCRITSTPPGATVTVNNQVIGVTPLTHRFVDSAGFDTYYIQVEKEGYRREFSEIREGFRNAIPSWWIPATLQFDLTPVDRKREDQREVAVPLQKMPDVPESRGWNTDGVWEPDGLNKIWLLAVGISRYESAGIDEIPYASADAEKFASWITSSEGPNVPASNVRLLFNERATRDNFVMEIDWLRRRVAEKDLLVVYIACHGVPEPMVNGRGFDAKYLTFFDTNPEYPFVTGISNEMLKMWLDQIRAKVQLVIYECCYAGAFGRAVMQRTPMSNIRIEPVSLGILGKEGGRILLTASKETQVAFEDPNEIKGGVFTDSLLKVLGPGNRLLLRDCFPAVRDATERRARELGSMQTPERYGAAQIDILFKRK